VAGRRRRDDQGSPGRPEDRPESNRQSQKGAKRSVLCEGAGVPVGLAHDGANRNDHKLLKRTLDSISIQRPKPTAQAPQGLCLDKAYDNAESRAIATDDALTPHIRTRGEELEAKAHTPGWRARRWVVAACHSWINRNRALLIRWSKKDDNHLALLMLACGLIAFKKARAAALPG
jgi:putative transposase